jgi:hypothetical protein
LQQPVQGLDLARDIAVNISVGGRAF